jgi:hypothetical protein
MSDDAARIAQLEAKLATSRQSEAAVICENAKLVAAHSEALEQQTATSEILRIIASSPTSLTTVLNAVVRSAARLCPAATVGIWRVAGDELEVAALLRADDVDVWVGKRLPLTRTTINGRAVR